MPTGRWRQGFNGVLCHNRLGDPAQQQSPSSTRLADNVARRLTR